MDCRDEMTSVLDEQLLLNIKNSEIDPENDQRMEEGDLDMELKIPIEGYADPLQETVPISTNFLWLFNDKDILLDDEQLSEVVLKPGKARIKRGRPSSKCVSFNSSSGHIWNLERDKLASAQEELMLPRQQACGKGPARSVSNAVESWMLLFDDEMLRMLLHQVNEQIRQRHPKNIAKRPVDLTELRSWLGLNYLCGVFRNSQHNGPLEELWTLELGNPIFRATMSLSRFEFIANCLSSQSISCWNDGLRLWEKLLINCRSYYGPSGWLCVDEQPVFNNMLLVLCCDAKTLYMSNALLNKREVTNKKELMQLICDYKTTGRNITLGPRYASVKHCDQLLRHNLSSICTLRPSSLDYPKAWSGETLLSGSKKLTHQFDAALLTCGLNGNLNALQTQQHTFQICQNFLELSRRYSTAFCLPARVMETEPDSFLPLFHLMLNIAAVNAWVLLRLSPKGDANIDQRDFQRQLGLFLTQQRLQRRLHRRSTTTPLVMRLQICEILGQSSQRLLSEASSDAKQANGVGVISLHRAMLPDDVTLVSRYGDKLRRCKPCARNKRENKARTRCQQCQAHLCGNHLISRCFECMGLATSQLPGANIKSN